VTIGFEATKDDWPRASAWMHFDKTQHGPRAQARSRQRLV
jgi:hypothetical protein